MRQYLLTTQCRHRLLPISSQQKTRLVGGFDAFTVSDQDAASLKPMPVAESN